MFELQDFVGQNDIIQKKYKWTYTPEHGEAKNYQLWISSKKLFVAENDLFQMIRVDSVTAIREGYGCWIDILQQSDDSLLNRLEFNCNSSNEEFMKKIIADICKVL